MIGYYPSEQAIFVTLNGHYGSSPERLIYMSHLNLSLSFIAMRKYYDDPCTAYAPVVVILLYILGIELAQ
uniref:Uncharacterized protein n=1 Tax=Setaria digitata TaxID=48799 RepID=A0A915PYF0_9BILA